LAMKMLSVKGVFEDGAARPSEPVAGRDGQIVVITFLDEVDEVRVSSQTAEWGALIELVEECALDTGIPDLAHQHDHYLHGTPKKD